MGFFSDLKEDLSQAVNELMPEEELNQGDVAETKEQPVKNMPETTEKSADRAAHRCNQRIMQRWKRC